MDSAARPSPWPVAFVVGGLLLGLITMLAAELAAQAAGRHQHAVVEQVTDRRGGPLRAEDEGRLVRVQGLLLADAPLIDDATGIAVSGRRLRRVVEVWQSTDLSFGQGAPRPWERWGAAGATPPPGTQDLAPAFLSARTWQAATRIGDVPLAPDPADAVVVGRALPAAEVAAALAPRFPGRSVSVEEGWTVLAQDRAARRPGDVRLQYRVLDAGQAVTMVGRVVQGRLAPAAGPWRLPLPGDLPVQALLSSELTDRAEEWRFMGRIAGGLLIVLGVMVAALHGRDDGRLPAAMQWEPIAALVMIPFAVIAAPAVLAAIVLSWWMAQGTIEAAIGGTGALAAAAMALWLAFRGGARSG